MKIYDIAFVGMGASALGTYKLKYHNQDASIIGIDRDFNNSRNNFFAFWMTDWMAPFKDIVKNKWNKWEFYNQHQKLTHEGIGFPYCVIRYQDWKHLSIPKATKAFFIFIVLKVKLKKPICVTLYETMTKTSLRLAKH